MEAFLLNRLLSDNVHIEMPALPDNANNFHFDIHPQVGLSELMCAVLPNPDLLCQIIPDGLQYAFPSTHHRISSFHCSHGQRLLFSNLCSYPDMSDNHSYNPSLLPSRSSRDLHPESDRLDSFHLHSVFHLSERASSLCKTSDHCPLPSLRSYMSDSFHQK